MPFLDHAGNDSLRYDERGVQIHIDDLAELCGRHFCHRDALDDACIVDEDVYHADFLFDTGNQGIDGCFICHVAHVAVGFDTFFLICGQSFVHQFLLDVVENDGGTALCESRRNAEPDSVRCSGNQSNLAFQREILQKILFHVLVDLIMRFPFRQS